MRHIKASNDYSGKLYRVAIVVSLFNTEVTQELLRGALNRLHSVGIVDENIMVLEVPGAIEIPLATRRVLQTKQWDVAITLGAVIRGETSHYDYVCQQVSHGVQQVSLELDIPVIFGVLTIENEQQAWDRLGGEHGHKGEEAVDAALAVIDVLTQLTS